MLEKRYNPAIVNAERAAYMSIRFSSFLADSAFIFYARSCRSGGVSFDVRV